MDTENTKDERNAPALLNDNHAETRKSNRRQRQRNNNKKKKQSSKGSTGYSKNSKFTGAEDEMKGHVFQCREESKTTLQFQRTCKELVRYVASTYEDVEEQQRKEYYPR